MSTTATSLIGGPGSRPLGSRKKEKKVLYGQLEWQPLDPVISPKVIQGDIGEGGGQVIRYATLVSVLGNIPLQLERIRAGKIFPGLRPDHLHTVVMLARLCRAKLAAAYVGSKGISMIPNASFCQDMEIDPETCASVTLLAQAALPVLLFSMPVKEQDGTIKDSSCLLLHGATDIKNSPPLDYFIEVFLKMLDLKLGIKAKVVEYKRGFSPKGQGWMRLQVESIGERQVLKPVQIMHVAGEPVRATIKVFRSGGGFPSKCEEACMLAAKNVLAQLQRTRYPNLRIIMRTCTEPHEQAYGDGLGILITCQCNNATIASSGVGDPEVQKYLAGQDAKDEAMREAQRTGREAAEQLVDLIHTGSPIDSYLQDQVVLYMALAQGKSVLLMSEPTVHTLTAIDVCTKMIDCKFEVYKPKEGPNENQHLYLVICNSQGIALQYET